MCVPGFKDFVPGEPATRPVGTPGPPGAREEHWGEIDAEMTLVGVCMTKRNVHLIMSSAELSSAPWPWPAGLQAARVLRDSGYTG